MNQFSMSYHQSHSKRNSLEIRKMFKIVRWSFTEGTDLLKRLRQVKSLWLAVVFRRSPPDVFLGKDVLKICTKFTRRHPCWGAISVKLLSKLIEIKLRHRCSLVNLKHIFRIPFSKNTSEEGSVVKKLNQDIEIRNVGILGLISKFKCRTRHRHGGAAGPGPKDLGLGILSKFKRGPRDPLQSKV